MTTPQGMAQVVAYGKGEKQLTPAPVSGGRRGGPWLAHVKKTMRLYASKKSKLGKKWFNFVLKSAKKSYHKKKRGGKGGDDEESGSDNEETIDEPAPGGGRRRPRGGRTQRRERR